MTPVEKIKLDKYAPIKMLTNNITVIAALAPLF